MVFSDKHLDWNGPEGGLVLGPIFGNLFFSDFGFVGDNWYLSGEGLNLSSVGGLSDCVVPNFRHSFIFDFSIGSVVGLEFFSVPGDWLLSVLYFVFVGVPSLSDRIVLDSNFIFIVCLQLSSVSFLLLFSVQDMVDGGELSDWNVLEPLFLDGV